MAEAITITERPPQQDVFDIRYLRETGIALLQQYSGNRWTDYNIHDPGITLLETICMALAEIGYRADYDITELLGKLHQPGPGSPFTPAETVLPCMPVTIDDTRRLLLGIDGVRNLRITKSRDFPEFSGLLEVEVQLAEDIDTDEEKSAIEKLIREQLDNCRKPGEDYLAIRFLEPEFISFDLDLEVENRIDSSDLFHSIASSIDQYLSPFVHLYSLSDMEAKGYDLLAAFEGPLMNNGFTTGEELDNKQFRRKIYTSDLVTILMDIPNVKAVKKITINPEHSTSRNWYYTVQKNKVPRISHSGTKINIWYRGTIVSTHTLANTRIDRSLQSLPKPFDPSLLYPAKAETSERKLTEYQSIQHDLPQTYGVSEYGLSGEATPEREGLAHQLKAFLRIFDQVIYNSLLQLSHARYLLSPGPVQKTYLSELVSGAPGEEYIYRPFVEEFLMLHAQLENRQLLRSEWRKYLDTRKHEADSILQKIAEDEAVFFDRRNRALDHLLARSGYDPSFFEYVCGFSDSELLAYKEMLLQQLPFCDGRRSILQKTGGDYITGTEETLTGFELRLALLTGIRTKSRKSLAAGPALLFNGQGGEEIEAEVFGAAGDDAINLLFENGTRKEMYAGEKQQQKNTLVLYNSSREPVARFTGAAIETLSPAEAAGKIAARFAEADIASEGYHLLDHLLLRPADDVACFGFDALNGEEIIFSCTPSLSRAERDRICALFLADAGKADQYIVMETGYRQFKIAHKASQQYLRGTVFFTSRELAENAVAGYVHQFSKAPGIVYTTAFRDLYSNTEDPFSNILTFILPSWPSRFRNEAYRKYIEESIARQCPAHLVVNMRWLGYAEMQLFENAWSAWLGGNKSGSAAERKDRLQNLLSLVAG